MLRSASRRESRSWVTAPTYDVIVSLDVLEHIPSPVDAVEALTRLLKPGGLLILNIAFGLREDTPEHLVPRRLNVLDRIRGLGLQKANMDTFQVFFKSAVPGPSLLRRSADVCFALWEDARYSKRRPICGGCAALPLI